jgi:hypothetical protein
MAVVTAAVGKDVSFVEKIVFKFRHEGDVRMSSNKYAIPNSKPIKREVKGIFGRHGLLAAAE